MPAMAFPSSWYYLACVVLTQVLESSQRRGSPHSLRALSKTGSLSHEPPQRSRTCHSARRSRIRPHRAQDGVGGRRRGEGAPGRVCVRQRLCQTTASPASCSSAPMTMVASPVIDVTDQLLLTLSDIKTDGKTVPPPTLTVERRGLKGASRGDRDGVASRFAAGALRRVASGFGLAHVAVSPARRMNAS
jgi:hypothetical protein